MQEIFKIKIFKKKEKKKANAPLQQTVVPAGSLGKVLFQESVNTQSCFRLPAS